jgi:hypothetical protein
MAGGSANPNTSAIINIRKSTPEAMMVRVVETRKHVQTFLDLNRIEKAPGSSPFLAEIDYIIQYKKKLT